MTFALPLMRLRTRLASGPLARRDAARQRAADRARLRRTPEPRYPLDLVFCRDCSARADHRDRAAGGAVLATTSTSRRSPTPLSRRHAAIAERMIAASAASGRTALVDRGCAQRRLPAAALPHAGVPVLGIEPARNIARVARGAAASRPAASSSAATLARATGRRRAAPTSFHANNVLAHVADLNGFVAGIRIVLDAGRRRGHRGAVRAGHDRQASSSTRSITSTSATSR